MFVATLSQLRALDKDCSLTKELLASYVREAKKGDCAENKALALAKAFFDTEDAWLAKTGHLLDNSHKVDLVVKIAGNKKYRGLQVKSSEHGAQEHEALRNTKEWEYGFPECLVRAPGYKMAAKLSELLDAQPNERYTKAFMLWSAHRGSRLQAGVPGLDDLVLLDLAVPVRGEWLVR